MRTLVESRSRHYVLKVSKVSERRLNPDLVESQLSKLTARILSSTRRNRGWSATYRVQGAEPAEKDGRYTYTAAVRASNNPLRRRQEERVVAEWEEIVGVVTEAGRPVGWSVAEVQGKPVEQPKTLDSLSDAELTIPDDWATRFDHIYGRDDQIDMVMGAIRTAAESNFLFRFHAVLEGPPAGGKTEITRSVKTLFGEEAVLEYDGTNLTQAGLVKDLAERAVKPRIILVEEIEKADPEKLRPLLALLDHRAEIRKVTARGQIHQNLSALWIVTVNNYEVFSKVLEGALASRFPNVIHFPRPNRQLLTQILTRDVERVHGKLEWIKPALDYAEANGINDPRRALAIALQGKDELLDGTFQARLDATRRPKEWHENL